MKPLLLLTAFLSLLTGCATSQSQNSTPAASTTVRVMSYNIHHGEGVDRKFDLDRIARLIQEEKVDVVALQEIDRGVQRTKGVDIPAELARLTGMTCLFSNNFHYQGGEYGNALLTRLPVVTWTNLHYRMLFTNEQRGFLVATLRWDGRQSYNARSGTGILKVVSTHLDYRPDHAERLTNIVQLKNFLAADLETPLVVAGDFNATPESLTHQAMTRSFSDSWEKAGQGNGFTISATKPTKRIDYIFYRGRGLAAVKAWVPHSEASDHLPVVTEFRISP